MRTLYLVVLGLIISNSAYSLDKLKVSAPPSIWTIVGNTTLEGPVIDLTTSIFSELGIEIQTVPLPWIRALKKLEDGSLDMILTIFHTEERAKIMDFTSSYVIVPTVIVVAKGKGFPFAKPNDLIGLSGLKQRGASLGKEFEKIAHKLKLYEVNTETQIVRMLNIGRADYAVGSKYVILISAKRIGLQDKIEILPKPVTSRDLRMAFSKKSKFLKYLPQVNKKILQRKKSGMIADMVKKAIDTASKK